MSTFLVLQTAVSYAVIRWNAVGVGPEGLAVGLRCCGPGRATWGCMMAVASLSQNLRERKE